MARWTAPETTTFSVPLCFRVPSSYLQLLLSLGTPCPAPTLSLSNSFQSGIHPFPSTAASLVQDTSDLHNVKSNGSIFILCYFSAAPGTVNLPLLL